MWVGQQSSGVWSFMSFCNIANFDFINDSPCNQVRVSGPPPVKHPLIVPLHTAKAASSHLICRAVGHRRARQIAWWDLSWPWYPATRRAGSRAVNATFLRLRCML